MPSTACQQQHAVFAKQHVVKNATSEFSTKKGPVGALANSHEIIFKNWVSLRTIAHRIYIHPSIDGEHFFPFLVENSQVAFLMRNCFAKQHCRGHDVEAKCFENCYFY